ncbi:unnamed protein product [Clavelina lepadiformis]|uniref:CYTH domain-containing protein n=1 Tax=Clavelina lepadiformis TaxID=159417 RepID=A0ABP0FHV9_CLALP
MPQNVEIKAKVNDLSAVLNNAKRLSNEEATILQQRDVFYNCPNGRLKLRFLSQQDGSHQGLLVFYQRPDKTGPKVSDYVVTPVSEPEAMDRILTASLGSKGVVCKQRCLFMVGQTRIHIDKVQGLGNYLELEVQIEAHQSPEDGAVVAHALMKELEIAESDLVTGAYMDMLLAKH